MPDELHIYVAKFGYIYRRQQKSECKNIDLSVLSVILNLSSV